MTYFILHQDRRIQNAPKLNVSKQELRTLRQFPTPEDMEETIIIYVEGELMMRKIDYPDLIEGPVLFISEKFKSLMSKYQRNIWMRTIVLIDKKTDQQRIYYAIYPPQLSCASKHSTLDFDDEFKTFILDETQVGHHRIFMAKGMKKKLIVRLDVAESLLRRQANGVIFEEIKNEKEMIKDE